MTKNIFFLLCFLPSLASASWIERELIDGATTRSYFVYTPRTVAKTSPNGIMVYLHGYGASRSSFPDREYLRDWDIVRNSETFNLIGVVPVGSPVPGDSESFQWNIDDPRGINEVDFIHNVLRDVSSKHSVPILPSTPRMAIGFSNGAGLAALLGCHSSNTLYVAHIAVHIDRASNYPSTCAQPAVRPVFSAVGTADFFITSLTPSPEQGIKNQFKALHASTSCPNEEWSETISRESTGLVSCYDYTNCERLGQLCVYDNVDHSIRPSMTLKALTYLERSNDNVINGGAGVGSGSSDNYDDFDFNPGNNDKPTASDSWNEKPPMTNDHWGTEKPVYNQDKPETSWWDEKPNQEGKPDYNYYHESKPDYNQERKPFYNFFWG